MSVRNYEEYRAEVLEGLGATAEDIRNEASWRAKVLEALGAEYTDEDTRNFERYRLKVLENLSGGGGGGSSDFSTAEVTVTFNGTSYLDMAIISNDSLNGDQVIEENGVYIVPLYKGKATAFCADQIETTGSITETSNVITITGNGTITIEGEQ